MNILIIEDDLDLAELIQLYLIPEGWNVTIVHDGKEALNHFNNGEFDLILLDLMLKYTSGFEICRAIREKSTIPIIMVTALEDPVHKVQGLNLGADDYITKPFEPSELIARIKSQLRRTYEFSKISHDKSSDERMVNDIRLNKKTHKCYHGHQEIDLTPKEFEILWLLMEEPGRVYNMDDIYYTIWGDNILNSEVNPVMVHIRRIRKKFEVLGLNHGITTVWGVGYKIDD